MTKADDVDPRVDALYELPVAEFTAARNDLVRALKAEQRRDQAAVVAKLRRPTVAAWAVNQVVRRNRDRFTALLDAGADVRRAQRRALSGVRDSGMRDAARVRRRLIDELTAAAVGVLDEHGTTGDAHRDDIAATFDVASADDEAASDVAAARLTAPLQVASGFGSLDGLTVLADEPPGTSPGLAGDGVPDDDGTDALDDEADQDDADQDDAAERARIAELRRDAMRAVEQARRDLADAEATAREAADAVVARSAAADEAARAVSDAEQTLRRRQREADDLRGQVAAEERRAEQAQATIAEYTTHLREQEQVLRDLTRASMPM